MRSRFRSKGEPSPYKVKITYSDGSTEEGDFGIHRSANTPYEECFDVVGNRFPGMNPCKHVKVHPIDARPRDWSKTVPSPTEIFSPKFVTNVTYGHAINNLVPNEFVPDPDTLNSFLWDSAIEASTQVPEVVSIANFLWEIKEEILKIIKDFWEYMLKWLTPGGAYLGSHFGIKQFVEDCKKISQVLDKAKKRLKHLRDTYGKPTSYRFRKKIVDEEFPRAEPYDPSDSSWSGCAFVVTHLVKRHVTLHATWLTCHTFPGLESAMALLDVMGASLGLQNPIKVIWNAIPFSWLLDYFVDTGPFFDSLQLPSFSGEFTVLATCHGWKVTETYQSWMVDHYWIDGSLQVHFREIDDVKVTQYIRRPGIPLGNIFSRQGDLLDHQWRIILALILGAGVRQKDTWLGSKVVGG